MENALTHLNFLKLTPLTNWLDYLIDQKKFSVFLQSRESNEKLQLADQFLEQALFAENDLIQIKKKQFEITADVVELKNRSTILWLFAATCLSTCEWDIEAFLKTSNVLRILYLLDRLTENVLPKELQQENDDHFYQKIFSFDHKQINSQNIFVFWLYARLILLVDSSSRFIEPTTKASVSNPFLQIDQKLVFAEQIGQSTLEVRNQIKNAMDFLEKILSIDSISHIDVPRKDFFLHHIHTLINEGFFSFSIGAFENDTLQKKEFFNLLEWRFLELKTNFDMMSTHFCARHFKTAKKLCIQLMEKINDNDWEKLLLALIRIPKDEFKGFKAALSVEPIKKKQSESPFESDPSSSLTKYAKAVANDTIISPQLLVKLIMAGIGIPLKSMDMPSKLVAQELINAIQTEINQINSTLSKAHLSQKRTFDSTMTEKEHLLLQLDRLYAAVHFLSALSPAFSELVNENPFLDGPPRKLVQPLEDVALVEIPPIPSDAALDELSSSGPPLWNLLTSFNIKVLTEALQNWDPSRHQIPYRHHFSQLLSNPILNNAGPRFNRLAILLWRVEQLAKIDDQDRWERLLNGLAIQEFPDLLKNQDFTYLTVYDAVRVKAEIWNRQFCRTDNPVEFNNATVTLISTVEKTMQIANEKQHNLSVIASEICAFLLNNRCWEFILKDNRSLKSPFFDLSLLLAAYFVEAFKKQNLQEAIRIAKQNIWITLTPTFESQNIGRKGGVQVPVKHPLIKQQQLIEFISKIKEVNTLDFFLGFCITLYNSYLAARKAELLEHPTQPVTVLNPEAHIKAAKKKTEAASTSESTSKDRTKGGEPSSTMTPVLADNLILKSVNPLVKNEQALIWQSVDLNELIARLDIPFLEQIIALICQNALIANPCGINYLRVHADFAFARGLYREAITSYLETLMGLEDGYISSSDQSLTKQEFLTKNDAETIYEKIVASLYFLRMPTLAAIFGQFRENISEHIKLIEAILQSTLLTVDAGTLYFSLIFDFELAEEMAVVYDKLELPIYLNELLRSCFDKSINKNLPAHMLTREIERRKRRILEILLAQFFDQNT